jgi:hypothetical protein
LFVVQGLMLYFVARTDIELLDRVRSLNPKKPASGLEQKPKQQRGPRPQAQAAQPRFGADIGIGGGASHSQLGGLGGSGSSSSSGGSSGGNGRSDAGSVASSLADASRLAAPPVQALHRGRCVLLPFPLARPPACSDFTPHASRCSEPSVSGASVQSSASFLFGSSVAGP